MTPYDTRTACPALHLFCSHSTESRDTYSCLVPNLLTQTVLLQLVIHQPTCVCGGLLVRDPSPRRLATQALATRATRFVSRSHRRVRASLLRVSYLFVSRGGPPVSRSICLSLSLSLPT